MKPSKKFDYSLDYQNIDFKKNPELYRRGKGEQGVLLVRPYKHDIGQYWRFKTPSIAKESSTQIYDMFLDYLEQDDFVGADMARKFLMMGWTRARRYANHKSGKKYSNIDKKDAPEIDDNTIPDYRSQRNRKHYIKTKTKKVLPRDPDPEKAESARIFKEKYDQAKNHPKYLKMVEEYNLRFT